MNKRPADRTSDAYETGGDMERYCSKCESWFPADREFFYLSGHGDKLSTWCKACTEEYKREKGYNKPKTAQA